MATLNTAQLKTDPSPIQKKPRQMIGEEGRYFLSRIQGETGENITACYQCERCTNACPVSTYMDIKPHQVIRHIQLGWREALMHSSTIWVCLSCEMCTTYCPNEVGVAETIIHLRSMAAHSSIPPKERHLAVFHRTFMTELQRFGRVNEFWLMNAFNLKPGVLATKAKSGLLLDEIIVGLTLWRKGRLNVIPRRTKAIKEIKKIYRTKAGDIT